MAALRLVAILCATAFAALAGAALMDPGHDVRADYMSWLSDGPYAWLAPGGLTLLAGATALVARHVTVALPPSAARQGVATALWCAAGLVLATMVVSSRGYDEPLLRQAVHVSFCVGALVALAGAAALFTRIPCPVQRTGRFWTRLFFLLAPVWWASSLLGRAGGPDYRGAMQFVMLACAMAWLVTASRLAAGSAIHARGHPGSA